MAAHLPIDWQGEPRDGHIECFYRYRRKDGKLGHVDWHFVACSMLRDCQLCGRRGSPRRVSHRGGVYGWNCDRDNYSAIKLTTLCTGCWNRARRIADLMDAVYELEYLIRKLKRTKPDGNDGG